MIVHINRWARASHGGETCTRGAINGTLGCRLCNHILKAAPLHVSAHNHMRIRATPHGVAPASSTRMQNRQSVVL